MKTYNSPFSSAIDAFLNQNLSDVFGVDVMRNRPSVNIKETGDKHVLELAIPGIKKENISITVEQDSLVVKSEEAELNEGETTTEDRVFKHREFDYANFERRFSIPEAADVNKIDAKYEAGILTISIAKKEEAVDNGPINIQVS